MPKHKQKANKWGGGSKRVESALHNAFYDAAADQVDAAAQAQTVREPSPIQRVSIGGHGGSGGGGTLFIGALATASSRERLAKNGITAVVNCCGSRNKFAGDGIVYLDFDISDFHYGAREVLSSPHAVLGFFREFFAFCDRELARGGTNLLVHCRAGAHRAGAAGVAYLMYRRAKQKGEEPWSSEDAIAFVQSRRPRVDPYHGRPSAHGREPVLADLLKGLERALSLDGGSSSRREAGCGVVELPDYGLSESEEEGSDAVECGVEEEEDM